jgi:hypothetical protein
MGRVPMKELSGVGWAWKGLVQCSQLPCAGKYLQSGLMLEHGRGGAQYLMAEAEGLGWRLGAETALPERPLAICTASLGSLRSNA